MNNDCDTVALLLNHGDVNVNAMAIQIPIEYEFDKRVYKNVYPIHMACHFGSPRLFSYLVRQDDIKIKVHDDCDRSILHYAFKNCNYEVYKNVLKFRGFNCKQDKCAYDGYPIHIVCQVNNIQGAHFLLSQPLIELDDTVDDRRNKKDYGKTPLLLASCRGYGEITKAILDHGRCDINARIEATGETTFLNCCYYGLDEVIDTLMRKKAFTMKRQIFSNGVLFIYLYDSFNISS
ncbi:hypothetical protein TRFO_27068 [Tritrichomonas foetus]|uniref:Uncharacterized protein n=1 Tax=Tritrichomonas foetus TaxID=1144522 RepID=A0A1J4K745_9EUKA|nr:hypothetical protein TRFO_27068 [Tritrichomonas foetus]|eukprot:OHT05253.1 hypothetical protein TRFO_27068 [Tritrichomonas foetus]